MYDIFIIFDARLKQNLKSSPLDVNNERLDRPDDRIILITITIVIVLTIYLDINIFIRVITVDRDDNLALTVIHF